MYEQKGDFAGLTHSMLMIAVKSQHGNARNTPLAAYGPYIRNLYLGLDYGPVHTAGKSNLLLKSDLEGQASALPFASDKIRLCSHFRARSRLVVMVIRLTSVHALVTRYINTEVTTWKQVQ